MTEAASNQRDPGYSWQRIFQLATAHKREIIVAHLIALAATLCSVPIPLLMPLLVDEVLLEQPAHLVEAVQAVFPESWHSPALYIGAILLFTLVLRLMALVLNVWQTRNFTVISKDVVYKIRLELVGRLRRVSMREYETLGSGQVISHLVTDLDTLDQFIGSTLSKLLIASLSLVGTAVILLWMHWQLALFILVLNPLVIYITTRIGRQVKDLKKRENQAYSRFQQVLTEVLEAIQQVRASNRENYYLGKVTDSADQIKEHATQYAWKTDAASRLSFSAFVFGFDTFRAISMLMVLFSDLSLGEMMAVFGYLWFMLAPMQEVLSIQYAYHSANAALGRVNTLFDLHWEPRYPHQQNPFKDKKTTAIQLKNIDFSYDGQTPVLQNLSLSIKPGEKVALVGASGGGKTTLVQILLGLYEPERGEVYFDGVPVKQIGLDVVRENVATVLQHPALFNDSLRMNLTLGREYPEQQLWRALEVAQLDEFVRELENGLDTVLGRQGVRLSGGQRQRVAVARMVLSDPRIVILDEATSALDTATEARLHRAMEVFLEGRTTIIVAHRLSAVKQADRVFVFDSGQIIEEGHHDELIQTDGLYAKLYRQ